MKKMKSLMKISPKLKKIILLKKNNIIKTNDFVKENIFENIVNKNVINKTNVNLIKLFDIIFHGKYIPSYEFEDLYDDINENDIDTQTDLYIKFPKLHQILARQDSNEFYIEDQKIRVKKKLILIFLGGLYEIQRDHY
jgi:hypothetical protein